MRKWATGTGLVHSLAAVGSSNEMLGNYAEALKNYFASLKIANELGDKEGKRHVYLNVGNIKVKMHEYAEAKQYYDTAYALAKELGDIERLKSCYDGMAGLDSAQGNYKSSLKYYKLFVQYRDSLVNDENKKQLVQQQMQYDFDKKETATKTEQDKKDAVALEEAKRQRNIRNSSFAGIAALLLFSVVVIRQRNKVSKAKKRSDELLLNILPFRNCRRIKSHRHHQSKTL